MIDVLGAAAAVRNVARLRAVAATGLGAAPHPWFDRAVIEARRALGVPIVLLVLVERTRQIMPGAVGLPDPWQQRREVPLTYSICQYVIGAGTVLTIPDTGRDPVLHSSDAVRDFGIAAYAGVPVRGRDGHLVGALAAVDVRPREWTADQLAELSRVAERCGRKLRALSTAAAPAVCPGAGRPEPAAEAPPPPETGLWTPQDLPADLTLDRRPPLRSTAAEVALAGRWHGEPVAVLIRTADHPSALARFRHRIAVTRAFRRTPPLVPVDEHRWNDGRILVVSRSMGEPLQADADEPPPTGQRLWSAVMRTAALLSTWHPEPPDERAWTVDYDAWIVRHEHRGRLTAEDARRLREALRACRDDRTFAHGSLTPREVVRLPSNRFALTGFADAGVYLAGFDLAALALCTSDAEIRHDVTLRVREADIVEPFAVNLLLRVADESGRPPGVATAQGLARRHATLVGARRHARALLARLVP